jgi:hypothetical protein
MAPPKASYVPCSLGDVGNTAGHSADQAAPALLAAYETHRVLLKARSTPFS